MDCSKFEELIDAYIEGSLSDVQNSEFEEHMADCASCRDSFEFSTQIYNTLHTLHPISVPDDFLTQLNARIDNELKGRKKPKRDFFKIPVKYYGAAACVLLAVALSFNNAELLKSLIAPETETSVVQSNEEQQPSVEPVPVSAGKEQIENEPVDISVEKPATSTFLPVNQTKQINPARAVSVKESKPAVSYSPVRPDMVLASNADETSPVLLPETKEPVKEVNKDEIEEVKKKIDSQTYTGRVVIASAVENAVVISEESVENTSREVDYLKSYALVKEAAEAKANPAVVGLSKLENVEVVSDSVIKYMDHDGQGNVGAVGNSVIVYKRDADKISDILQKFYTRECGEFYVISDAEYEQFLNELEANGIDYQKSDMKNTGSDDVMFKLVIA